jgi:membrane-bound lytic murein transglycosylase A
VIARRGLAALCACGLTACAGPAAPRADRADHRELLCESYRQADGADHDQLLESIDRTLAWLDGGGGDSADIRASLEALRLAWVESATPSSFAEAMLDACPSRTDRDDVHFTAYFAPEYPARRQQVAGFEHPLHAIPRELEPDNPARTTWHTRREIARQGLLADRAIAWLPDALSAYLVEVNGSARLDLGNGTFMHVGHVATNERPYTSLGRLLIDRGLADEASMSMATIRRLFEADPAAVSALMLENDRTVFFEELDAAAWPRSSLGIALTTHASIATDHAQYPPGVPVLVETTLPDGERYVRIMINQDTGGAIRGPSRADLFFGVGPGAGDLAGRMNTSGRVLVLRAD